MLLGLGPSKEKALQRWSPSCRSRKPTRCGANYTKGTQCTHGDGTQASRIDMVWAPTGLSKIIKGCEYHPSFLSDHQYLLVAFTLQPQFNSGLGVWKLDALLLQDPEYINLITSFWSHWQSMESHADFPSLMDWWDQGKFYLREVS